MAEGCASDARADPVAGRCVQRARAARGLRRHSADRQPVERRAASLQRAAERPGHAARCGPGRDDAADDPARRGRRHAAAGDLPRLPGDERRLRRHALAEAARGRGAARSPRGPEGAAGRAIRPGARSRADARRRAAPARRHGSHHREFAALAGRADARARPRYRGAGPGRRRRGVPRTQCAGVRPRRAVAPRVAVQREPIFRRAVRGFRRGGPRARPERSHAKAHRL